ncbi:MAG: pitrilysin family protein [Actinomycetota bacterium]|nr:pitrilysin family protein [Actinomycetota bacterium]
MSTLAGATAPRPEAGRLRLPRRPSVVDEVTDGGLHVIALRRPGVPLVEVRLAFPLRSRQMRQPAGPLVLSDSLLAGTKRYDRAGLAEAVERLGGGLGATVSNDRLDLSAYGLASRLQDLLALLADVLTGATYPAGEVAADRARKADEVVMALSRPEVLADEALSERLYGSHPYATPIPRPAALEQVGAPLLRRLHRSLLDPRSCHLVIVGDVQPRRALSLSEAALGSWLESPGGGAVTLPPLPEISPGGIELRDRPGAVQSNVRLGASAPRRYAPDWPAAAIANEILGGMFTSRLVENLRERHGYTYSPRSAIRHGRAGSSFTLSAEVGTEVTAASLVEIRYELGRLVTSGITEEELEAARRYAVGSFLVRTATQGGLASTLAGFALTGTGPEYLSDYPARIAKLTRAEVDEAARRYLSPGSMATVVVGDGEVVSASLRRLDELTLA